MSRRSRRLQEALKDSGFDLQLDQQPEVCGACLLDIDGVTLDGELFAVLDCCCPRHAFHVDCIITWADTENSCPQCKLRFKKIGIYNSSLQLQRVAHAFDQDQGDPSAATEGSDGDGAEYEEEEEEDTLCEVCGRGDDEEKLMLCDGNNGSCSGAAHYYCVGLRELPDGDWFCPTCTQSRKLQAAATQSSTLPVQVKEEPSTAVLLAAAQEPRAALPVKSSEAVQVKQELEGPPPTQRAGRAAAKTSSTKPASKKSAKPPTNGSSKEEEKVGELCKDEVKLEAVKVETDLSSYGSGFPKWISRRGREIRVDLSGRGMTSNAAKALADTVRSAVTKLFLSAAAKQDLQLSWHLAGNDLDLSMLRDFLEIGSSVGAHSSRLDLERNLLNAEAATWLAEWCVTQPRGPPQVLLLACNHVGYEGGEKLLHAVGTAWARHLRYCAEKGLHRVPMWVELRENEIDDVDGMLEQLAANFEICVAADASVCNAAACSASTDASPTDPFPALHLPYIMEQTPLSPKGGSEVKWELPALPLKDEKEEKSTISASPSVPSGKRKSRKSEAEAGNGRAVAQGRPKKVEAWYRTLGSKIKDVAPPQVTCFCQDDRPADKGLWDTVPRVQKKRSKNPSLLDAAQTPLAGLEPLMPPTKKARTVADQLQSKKAKPRPVQAQLPEGMAPRYLRRGSTVSSSQDTTSSERGKKKRRAEVLKAMKRLISQHMDAEKRLWKDVNRAEKLLRQRCLCEQIAKQAVVEFSNLVARCTPATWEAFLFSSAGYERAGKWIKKRILEVVVRCSEAATGRATFPTGEVICL